MNSPSQNAWIKLVVILIIPLTLISYWMFSSRPKPPARRELVVVGVGLYVKRNPDTHKYEVRKIFPYSPAEKAGLITGLVLNRVNGSLVETRSIKELSTLLLGNVGSKVTLELIDLNGTSTNVELLRAPFVNRSTR